MRLSYLRFWTLASFEAWGKVFGIELRLFIPFKEMVRTALPLRANS